MEEEKMENSEVQNEKNEDTVKEETVKENEKLKELEEMTDRYKRLMAEFENYKKRSLKEREHLYNSLLADIVGAILPVIDNLEKAVNIETKDTQYKQGVELVLKQLLEVISNLGVQEIETVGKKFDPELHEAVSHIQDEQLDEQIIKEEFRKGYRIGTKVIRHSMVVVAN